MKTEPILFTIFTMTAAGRIGEYGVLQENETSYVCISSYKNTIFVVKKEKSFKNKDDLKYDNFAKRLNESPKTYRVRTIQNTKNTAYKERYIIDYPEKLI